MPELPEVEHLRRTLEPSLIGAWVGRVTLRRRDIVTRSADSTGRFTNRELLAGATITRLRRRGKNLAIVGDRGLVLGVHLGMSGHMQFVPAGDSPGDRKHIHCQWQIHNDGARGMLIFRDPRRFGGLWTFPSIDALHRERWGELGPDALSITPDQLSRGLSTTKRSIKAALLDQSVLAGVGNIYADEAAFVAGVHPQTIASTLESKQVTALAKAIRQVLADAVAAGGSTVRTYRDGNGRAGSYAGSHRVYDLADLPCVKCRKPLRNIRIAQRTTTFCEHCQPLR